MSLFTAFADQAGKQLATAANQARKSVTNMKERIEAEHRELMSPGEHYGPLWEPPEHVERCRCCKAKFKMLKNRKFTCSQCAGVYCLACTHIVVATETASKPTEKGKNKEQKDNDDADDTTKRTSSSSRICDGCKRMETPGEDIREAIKQQLISEIARLEKRSRKKEARERPAIRNQFEETMDRASMNIAVKVADAIGKAGMEIAPVVPLLLHRGSAFSTNEGEENDEYDRPERMHGTTPPSSGYLEITNKSSVFFCIKILCSGGRDSNRLKFEVPRPSFIAVPPGGTVHAFFDDKKGPTKEQEEEEQEEEEEEEEGIGLDIMLLYDNPKEGKKKKGTSKIQYETHRHVDTANISPCAKVSLFRSVVVYSLRAKEQNIILKYKGKGTLEPRKGNNVREAGLVNVLLGRRTVGDIDLSTNVLSVGSTSYRLSV